MEYFLGSLITLAIVFFLEKYVRKVETKPVKLRHNQSHIYDLIKENHVYIDFGKPLETQATKHFLEKDTLKVVIHEGDAYWIIDNALFTAKVVDGDISKETTKIVDTMTPDKVELNKLIVIVEKLTEGSSRNDNWNSGN